MKKLTKNINSQFNPTLFNYKNGGFLGRNVGNLAQIAGGTVLTATGLGAPMGIGMMASGVGGMATTEVANKQQQQQAQQQQKQAIQQQMISNLPGQPQYVPTFARGGKLYHNKPNVARLSALYLANGGEITDRVKSFDTGGLHSENGGIPVGQNAMVERDEYMFTTKNGQKYIFSNKF